jgi:hypothetical protein
MGGGGGMESPPPLLKKFKMSFMIFRAHPFQWPSPSLSLPHQDVMHSLRPDGRGGGGGAHFVYRRRILRTFHIAVDF